ncbi:MAG: DNA polymerase, partial [Candidatus Limnocylindrus sp.]
MEPKRLLLVDAYGLIYRAFHAIPPLTNSRGILTNAAFGFTSILLRAIADAKPARAIVAFDAPGATHRHERFPAYKAQRPSMPDELRSQVPLVRDLVAALGLPLLEAPGYEADDVIGTIAEQARSEGWEVMIVSGDLDMLQLVGPNVSLLHTAKGGADAMVIYDPAKIFERYGLTPEQIVDFKALKGDSSDNIPGVPGVGEKTAAKLIASFGSLERLYQRLDDVEPVRIRELLRANREAAFAGQGLMTIDRDAPLTLPGEGGSIGVYDRDLALALLRELEFRALIGRLPPLQGEDREAAAVAVAAATAGAALRGVREPLSAVSNAATRAAGGDLQLGFDFNQVSEGNRAAGQGGGDASAATLPSETAVDYGAQIEAIKRGDMAAAGAALVQTPDEATRRMGGLLSHGVLAVGGEGVNRRGPTGPIALAIADEGGGLILADDPVVIHRLLTLVAAAGRELIGLGVKEIYGALLAIGAERPPRLVDDVALGSWISNVTLRNPGLVEVAAARLGADLPERLTPLQTASLCALVALASRAGLDRDLRAIGSERLYREIELPLIEVLARMEGAGIAVDQQALAQLGDAFGREITRLEAAAQASVGRAVALGSPKQLGELLFGELGLSRGKKTKTGAWSTDASVLEEIQGEHPIVGIALEWRTVSKLQSTYVEALPKLVEADGRIHTTFQQAVAATGRLSSVDPNLQNIPIRSELGRKIRHAFIAE